MLILILLPLLLAAGVIALLVLKRQTSVKIPLFLMVIALLCIGWGLYLIVQQLDELVVYRQLNRWEKTEGTILSAEVVGDRAIRPEIVYQYQVKDSIYSGQSSLGMPGFGGRNNRKQTARNILKAYPKGHTLTVYYDPAHPQNSRLKITPPWNVYMKLGFGAFIFLLGSVVDMVWFLSKKDGY